MSVYYNKYVYPERLLLGVLLEVPGRSGRLDLSEVLTGDVTYSNREIKLELAAQMIKENE